MKNNYLARTIQLLFSKFVNPARKTLKCFSLAQVKKIKQHVQ